MTKIPEFSSHKKSRYDFATPEIDRINLPNLSILLFLILLQLLEQRKHVIKNTKKLNILVIVPAFNEEKHLANCLDSLLSQSYLPKEIVVVNDGSTDNTFAIAQSYSKTDSMIQVVSSNQKSHHAPGAKVVEAFNFGLKTAKLVWDLVMKLDADVILPKHYFLEVTQIFNNDATVGMAGGIVYAKQNGRWQYENIANKTHLRGPIKLYSQACFKKIGGLRASIGWDTLDEILCQYHGYKISVKPELIAKVQKKTGSLYAATHAKKMGLAMYKMRYGFVIAFIAAAKAAWLQRRFSLFYKALFAFFRAYINQEKTVVSKEEGNIVRGYRWKKILEKIV